MTHHTFRSPLRFRRVPRRPGFISQPYPTPWPGGTLVAHIERQIGRGAGHGLGGRCGGARIAARRPTALRTRHRRLNPQTEPLPVFPPSALRVIKLTESLPTTRAADVTGKQQLRSATSALDKRQRAKPAQGRFAAVVCRGSVGANYRDSRRARSRADFVNKRGIVED